MTLRVLIADDEPLARTGLAMYLNDEDIEIVAECQDGLDTVRCIRELQPDLVFLDINMPELSGLEVVQEIGIDHMPLTIFLTAHDQHAVDAFRLNALDYLLKPINAEHFAVSLRRAREELEKNQLQRQKDQLTNLLQAFELPKSRPANRLLVRAAGHVYFLKPQDIHWVGAEGDYVMIHTANGKKHLVRDSMRAMEERLCSEGFQRIHRSSLVNLDAIRELIATDSGDYKVLLKDDTELRLSRHYRDQLYARLELS